MRNNGMKILCLLAFTGLGSGCDNGAGLPAFPGAEGFGMNATGGRGGRVIEVTNLEDSGPGSLRDAIETDGPRIVVFCVGGYIELQSTLDIDKPDITIAGQTAPGRGICLKNFGITINTDNVIIRYLRVRPSDTAKGDVDAISVLGGRNIIIDHCSGSWSLDEVVSVVSRKPAMGNISVQWCIIAESLNCSSHRKGCHGYASLIRAGYGNGVSYHHNLYAHNNGRNPRPGNYVNSAQDPCGLIFDFRNNVVYNWGGKHAGYNDDGKNGANSITNMNFVNNYYIKGPDSTGSIAFKETTAGCRAYFSGNWMDGVCPEDPWSIVDLSDLTDAQKEAYKQRVPVPAVPVADEDSSTSYTKVLADAGASFPDRDAIDKRIVDNVVKRTGRIINKIKEVGGYPVLEPGTAPADSDHDGMPDQWEQNHGLNPIDAEDSSKDRDGDGYTNIEEYINRLSEGHHDG